LQNGQLGEYIIKTDIHYILNFVIGNIMKQAMMEKPDDIELIIKEEILVVWRVHHIADG
jgi:hypothetical protein